MAHPFTVLTDGDLAVGGASNLTDAVSIMAAYYGRDGVHLRAVGEDGTEYASIGIPPEPPAETVRTLTLEVGSNDGFPALMYAFRVDGIQEEATIDYGDGTPQVTVTGPTPVDHTFSSPGSYRVTASEGERTAETTLTIMEPAGGDAVLGVVEDLDT